MSIDNIRLSEKAKTQLITIKRRTGIEHWNIMCRWAFCLSLAEKSKPPAESIPSDSNVEMTWRTFGGQYADIYSALLRERAHKDKFELDNINELDYFRLHLHRGISYLTDTKKTSNIKSLLSTLL